MKISSTFNDSFDFGQNSLGFIKNIKIVWNIIIN